MFLFGLPGHLDDGQVWVGWISMKDGWQWWNYGLVTLSACMLAYAVLPQRVLAWAGSYIRPSRLSHQSTRDEERIFTERTAGELLEGVRDLTSLQRDKFTEPHIGKWIRIQNVIVDISASGGFLYVTIGPKFSPNVVLCFSREKWRGKIETMRRSDRIAAEGKIERVDLIRIWLSECELVEIREEDDSLRRSSSGRPD